MTGYPGTHSRLGLRFSRFRRFCMTTLLPCLHLSDVLARRLPSPLARRVAVFGSQLTAFLPLRSGIREPIVCRRAALSLHHLEDRSYTCMEPQLSKFSDYRVTGPVIGEQRYLAGVSPFVGWRALPVTACG